MFWLVAFFLIPAFGCVDGSRIMILSILGTKSTMLNFQYLAEQLTEHGHEVIYVTGEKLVKGNPKNISYVVLPYMEDDSFQTSLFYNDQPTYYLRYWYDFAMWLVSVCDSYYVNKEINKIFLETNKIDAIIFDFYLQDCFLPLIHSLNAPILFYHGNALDPSIANMLDIPTPYATSLILYYRPTSLTQFWNRLFNAFANIQMRIIQEWFYYPAIEEITQKRIPNSPRITEIMQNASVMMGALDNVWSLARPAMPFVVDIGGLHCRPGKPLPPELEKAIGESGENGFILFALGTYFKPEYFPPGYLESFLEAFSKLKQVVLWKYGSPIKNLPHNVKIFKWLPQKDLLAHPKIKLFISHGGLYSIYEAIYDAVPILGIGIYADQLDNIKYARMKGIAYSINKYLISTDTVYEGINTVLNNHSYKDNIQEMSNMLKDQPETPLDRAIYWTEYVIRHKTVNFLHGNSRDLDYVQYFSLIEISILISILFLSLYFVYFIFIKLIRKWLCLLKK